MAHAYSERYPGGRHPGWPAVLAGLRVPSGLVGLRPVRLRDGATWSAIRIRDHQHLAPWEPTMPGAWAQRHAASEWPGRWLQLRSAGRRGTALPFAVTLDGQLVGHVMVGNIVREPLLSAYVGYWVESRVSGGGVITAAVAQVVDHCFGPVGLHRLEATVRPENAAEPAGTGQARVPAGGLVPPLPRRRRRLAGSLLLRADRRGGQPGRSGRAVGRAGRAERP